MSGLRRWWPVLLVAGGLVGVLVALAGRYGWHRDELYFLACGRRLAWGFVDQPPLTPALTRTAEALFGTSLVGLRLFPALAVGATVVLAAATAKELGGQRTARWLAALAMAASPLVLALGHLMATATFDLLAWTALTWLVVRLLRTGDERLWLAVGAVAGVGLMNKHLVLAWGLGLVAGLVLAARHRLRSPWLWAGGALAVLIWAPNLWWQAANDWPALDMGRSLREESGVEGMVLFAPSQLFVVGPHVALLWLPGLWWLARSPETQAFRPVALAYAVLVGVMVVTAGKPYYLAGLYPALVAAGAVVWERRRWRVGKAVATLTAGVVVTAPLVLPVLPSTAVRHVPFPPDLEQEAGAQMGWPELVDTVAEAHRPGETVFTANYGEAAAIELFGRGRLPQPYSGHNNYWLWGPPPASASPDTLVVGFPHRPPEFAFQDCRLLERFERPFGVYTEEAGAGMWRCRRAGPSWRALWPEIQAYAA